MSLLLVDDSQLVAEAIAGDGAALQAVVALNSRHLLEYIYRHLPVSIRGDFAAEDVLQDVFVEAFRSAASLPAEGGDAVARWLTTITRRRIAYLVRARTAAKRGGANRKLYGADDESGVLGLLDTLAIYHRSPSKSAAAHELAAALESSIDELPADRREAIRLRHVEGLSIEEVAARMNRTEGSVHQLCRRGLQDLRVRMRSRSIYV